MARKDLLAEAIADAKAVKETALANAKLALEEAFTPKLQSMISAKLAEEMEDELEEEETDEMAHEEETEEMAHEMAHDDEKEEMAHEAAHEEETEEMAHEEEETEETYHEEEETEETYHEEEEDDLDLESIIRELEMEDEVEPEVADLEDELEDEDDEEEDEEIDLEEVINALKEMAHEDEVEEDAHEDEVEEDLEAELDEAYKTIESLQATINEVNLLNAKLLYTNKLFRTFDLNESQKVKVLENFDRTSSVREVKLIFTTLAENLNVAKIKKTVVKEGYASKTIKSSAPQKKEIITEANNLASRWKKLAGLK